MVGRVTTTKLVGLLLAVLAAEALGQQVAPAPPLTPPALPFRSQAVPVSPHLAQAQAAYAQALTLEQSQHPASVDYYYSAIAASWLALAPSSTAAASLDPQAWAIYHDSLARLILEGQRHGRLDPRRGLTINTASGPLLIPTRYFGFSWKPEDFHQLVVVGDYRTKRPRHVYRRPGLGVPLVVVRYQNDNGGFLREHHPFAATAVLRPAVLAAGAGNSSPTSVPGDAGPSLDFCDSLAIRQVPLAGIQLDLAADITAPFAVVASQSDQMPVNPQVRMHSIIGYGYPTLTSGDSDGVVPVSSARHPGVQTETFVRAWHTEVHSHPETLQAMLYILSVHYADYQATALGNK